MAKYEVLNNVMHRNLRVINRHGPEFGDAVGMVPTFPPEFAEVQREYPIFFRKDAATGEFSSIALLGFAKDENLFLDDGQWRARHVPDAIARGPFVIGVQNGNAVVQVDMSDRRVSAVEGEPLFEEQGGESAYLAHIAGRLERLRQGLEKGNAMLTQFDSLGLIEPVNMEIKLARNEQVNLLGLHTVSRDRLRRLEATALSELNRAGFLQAAVFVLASMTNLSQLAERRQRLSNNKNT
jgi:hypothetical protein